MKLAALVESDEIKVIKRFAKCSHGGIALLTALLMTVILGVGGLAIDIGYWYTVKHAMQGAADAGAVEAAASYAAGNTSGYAASAKALVAQNGWLNGGGASGSTVSVVVNNPPQNGKYQSNNGAFEVVISRPQSPILAWVVGDSASTTVSVHAVSLLTTTGGGCVLALNSSTTNSSTAAPIYISGSGQLTATSCTVASNGTVNSAESSATVNTSSLDVGASFNPCTAGKPDAYCTGSPTVKTSVTTSDPYLDSSFETPPTTPAYAKCNTLSTKPTNQTYAQACYQGFDLSKSTCPSGCTFASGTYFNGNGSTAVTVGSDNDLTFGSPSGSNVFYFDGGVEFGGSGTTTLEPGIYYIEGGSFTVDAGATVRGTGGVTIILTKDATGAGSPEYATASIAGGSTLSLNAPTGNTVISGLGTEDTAGLVFFQDRNAPTSATNGEYVAVTFANGGNAGTLTGAIYTPEETVTLSGGASAGGKTTCLQVVAQYLSIAGSATFADGCTGDGTASFGGTSIASMVE